MAENPKSRNRKSDKTTGPVEVFSKPISVSDCLAVERTVMANERTLLAYVRTSLGVLVVAITVIKFFQSQGMVILGYLLLVTGIVCATIGLMRFTEMMHRLNELGRCDTNPPIIDNETD